MGNLTIGSWSRGELIAAVASRVPPDLGRPALVAVDGVDGSGKTRFADELAGELMDVGVAVIRASVDDFHHLRRVRYRRGVSSPLGFWLDSFNYARFVGELLKPLGASGNRRYRTSAHDLGTDAEVYPPFRVAPEDAVLLVEGIFLHRTELRGYWDFSVFLDVSFETSYARMAERDGSPADPQHRSNHRYLEGQKLYLQEAQPLQSATVVVDNNELAAPWMHITDGLIPHRGPQPVPTAQSPRPWPADRGSQ